LAREVVAPDALSGEFRRGGIGEQHAARRRIEAVGTDHKVVTSAAAVGKVHRDALTIVLQRRGLNSEAHRGTGFTRSRGQYLLQRTTSDANVGRMVGNQLRR